MGHFSEPFVEQGREQGRRQGRQQGRIEGEARALVRLLEKRFGPIPSSLHERILASDLISIEAWLDRAVDARELLSVFEPKGTA
jgi:hypothetical protein